MAKNKVEIDVKVDDKGSTKKVALGSKKAGDGLDKAAKSAGTYDRNIKGAAQATSNGTKEFAKMSQGMGGLVGVYATIAAQVFALSAAFQFMKSAMDISNLLAGQEALATTTGIAYKTLTQNIQLATDSQLGYADAARAAAIGTAAGLSPSQLTELGRAAKNASIALGRDLADSFDRLVRGVVKAEPEVLDELGIILRLKTATEKYAQSIGKPVAALTAFERSQAVTNDVLEQAEEKYGLIEARLDPTTKALNQFIKSFDDIKKVVLDFLAGPISAAASFFSDNMTALVGVLSLFGLSILRTIIPNLTQWRASTEATIETQKTKLAELRTALVATRVEMENLNLTQSQTLANATGVITAQTGKAPPTKGALGFLAGTTDTRQAKAAADRVLKDAEAGLKVSLDKRKGMLKSFTAEEIALLRQAYLIRAGLVSKDTLDYQKSVEAKKLANRAFMLELEMGQAQTLGFFGKVGAGATKLLSALGWIGLAVSLGQILFGIGKSIYNFFDKGSEAAEKMKKEVQELTTTYKSLSAEIERTQQYLAEGPKSGETVITAKTGMVTSFDIPKQILDVNRFLDMDPDTEGYKELEKDLKTVAMQASEVDERFTPLYDAIRNGEKLTESQADKLREVAREYGDLGLAMKKATEIANSTNGAVMSMINGLSKPMGADALVAIDSELSNIETRFGPLADELHKLGKARFDAGKADTSMTNKDGTKRRYVQNEEGTYFNVESVEGQEILNARIEAANNAYNKTAEQIKEMSDRKRYLVQLQTNLTTAIEDSTTATKHRNDELLRAQKMQTLGITFEGKRANLEADRIRRTVEDTNLQNKKRTIQAQINTLTENGTKDEKELSAEQKLQLATLRLTLSETNSEIDLMGVRHKLEQAGADLKADQLTAQEKLLQMKRDEFALETGLLAIANEKKRAQGGLTGTFGIGRAAEESRLEEQRLNQALAVAIEKADNAATRLRDLQNQKTPVAEGDMARATQEAQQAGAAVVGAQTDIDVFKARANAIINNVRAENELLELRTAGLSLNPAEQAYNDLLIQAKQQGVTLDEKQLQLLKEQAIAQVQLKTTLEGLEGIRNSIQSGLEGAFESLINGTKNFKQAFADMAKAILMDIAKMIAKQLALKALMAVGGFGFADGGVIPGGIGYANGGKIPGGFRAFANGGIVRQPTMGLIGEGKYDEAVVPLPNGQAIPVQMLGGTSQQNNVVVNVAVDQNGNATSSTKESNGIDAAKMGGMIAKAVQKELQEQKRAGGILNPYGSA